LAETLDSILAQTHEDFELIISDNASTDGTEQICRRYASRDDRIRYFRNHVNLGGAKNFRRVFALSSGEYFKWAAHDDLFAPTFLERCVKVLENDPTVALCYTRGRAIDDHGAALIDFEAKPNLGFPSPRRRFFEAVCVDHPAISIVPVLLFGVIRSHTLRKTPLIGSYASSDGVLLGEIALRGRLHEVPEVLFSYRFHQQKSTLKYPNRHALEQWYDPRRKGKVTFPHWRLLTEHFRSIKRTSIPRLQKLWCSAYLLRWAKMRWRGLLKDLLLRASISNRSGVNKPFLRTPHVDTKRGGKPAVHPGPSKHHSKVRGRMNSADAFET
jgi:glycosyltransferase involved in cell wall biosynthesis